MYSVISKNLQVFHFDWNKSHSRRYHYPKTTQTTFHSQKQWVQEKLPNGFWSNKDNQLEYMKWLAEKLEIKKMEDWYNVTHVDFRKNNGAGIIEHHGKSHVKLITSVYSDYQWLPWKFNVVPKEYWSDNNNVKNYLNWLSQQYNIKSMEDWYKITSQDLTENFGKSLLELYDNSVIKLITTIYNNYNWLPWKFKGIPNGFWKERENQNKYINWLSKELNINKYGDWYKVTYKDFVNNNGIGILNEYEKSHSNCIINLFAKNYNWLPWKFTVTPKGYFNEEGNRTKYMKWLSEELNINKYEDWYNVTYNDIVNRNGKMIIEYYGTYTDLIIKSNPNYNWLPWKFKTITNGYFNDKENQNKYMKWLSKELNINKYEDWYNVTYNNFINNNGKSLLAIYNHSHIKLITSLFPDYNWLPWKFKNIPNGYWKDLNNQRKFLDQVAIELGIKNLDDWYNVSLQEIKDRGGSTMIKEYETIENMFSIIYPEKEWDKYQYNKVPKGYRELLNTSKYHQKQFVEYLEKKLNIKKTSDWYLITYNQIQEIIKMKLTDVMNIVKLYYPDLNLKQFKDGNPLGSKKSQYILKSMLQTLFPEQEIVEEYRHSSLSNLELDYYLPQLKLAFEYQGQQHYTEQSFIRPLSIIKQLDNLKLQKANELGITVIRIPFWWDKKINSLIGTIIQNRPDIIDLINININNSIDNNEYKPIPHIQPSSVNNSQRQQKFKENIKSQLMLATNWNKENDPTGWWMSEKYDGIRLYWNGTQLYTRKGNIVKAPDFFTLQLPKFPLDGELWMKRGLHQASLQLTRSQREDLWKNATFCIFDVPDQLSKTYEERIEFLKNFARESKWPPFLNVIDAVKCESRDHLDKFFKEIVSNKGEGVMLREPESFYEHGRSNAMRRYKEYQDTEVRVIKNMYPHGLECQQVDGQVIFVAVHGENIDQSQKLKENTVITVKYSGMNVYNKMIQPVFFRTRNSSADMSWSDLVKQYKLTIVNNGV